MSRRDPSQFKCESGDQVRAHRDLIVVLTADGLKPINEDVQAVPFQPFNAKTQAGLDRPLPEIRFPASA